MHVVSEHFRGWVLVIKCYTNSDLLYFGWPAWLSGRTSVSGQRSFAVLCWTRSWRVTTYVGKPSVKLCDPCLGALRQRCIKALYKYSSFPFLLLSLLCWSHWFTHDLQLPFRLDLTVWSHISDNSAVAVWHHTLCHLFGCCFVLRDLSVC